MLAKQALSLDSCSAESTICPSDVRSGSLEWNRANAPQLEDDTSRPELQQVPRCSSICVRPFFGLEERAAAVASIIVRPPTLPIVTDCVLRLLIVALHQQPLQRLVVRDAASVAGLGDRMTQANLGPSKAVAGDETRLSVHP